MYVPVLYKFNLFSVMYSIWQEIKETGGLSSRVIAVYWKALGPWFGAIILLSLFLMQASRNLSDAWLAHWIRNINQSNVAPIQPNISLESEFHGQSNYIIEHAMCFLQKIFIFANLTECLNDDSNNNNGAGLEQTQVLNLETENSYYLAIYILIAIFNALIALVRAFAFAYAGIKAAKFIHNRLLYSVIYVRIFASIVAIFLSMKFCLQFIFFIFNFG